MTPSDYWTCEVCGDDVIPLELAGGRTIEIIGWVFCDRCRDTNERLKGLLARKHTEGFSVQLGREFVDFLSDAHLAREVRV